MRNIKLNKRGFTLIEVVLVLAIGGLIFLLAFLAFQQASINRRDTQRRSDAGRVLAEMQNAKGDGFTLTSSNVGTFKSTYLGNLTAPGGSPYNISYTTSAPTTLDYMVVYVGAKCVNGTNGISLTTSGASNNMAVMVKLEKGIACRDDA